MLGIIHKLKIYKQNLLSINVRKLSSVKLHLLNACFASTAPPEIVPFAFPVNSGLRGSFSQLICTVSTGETPLKIIWLHNKRPRLPKGVLTYMIGTRTSILTISNVTLLHSGVYECIASNKVGRDRHVAELLVKGML